MLILICLLMRYHHIKEIIWFQSAHSNWMVVPPGHLNQSAILPGWKGRSTFEQVMPGNRQGAQPVALICREFLNHGFKHIAVQAFVTIDVAVPCLFITRLFTITTVR